MTTSLAAPHTDGAAAFIEKRPLEQYVAPDRPSLVGLSRDALAAALGDIGVPGQRAGEVDDAGFVGDGNKGACYAAEIVGHDVCLDHPATI